MGPLLGGAGEAVPSSGAGRKEAVSTATPSLPATVESEGLGRRFSALKRAQITALGKGTESSERWLDGEKREEGSEVRKP